MTRGLQIVITGKGGREHALAWKLAQSPLIAAVHVIPGNAGMSTTAKVQCHDNVQQTQELVEFCRHHNIDWVLPGSESDLAAGMVDALQAAGIRALGPGKRSAMLEASKIFSKQFMLRHDIPTAKAAVCTTLDEALCAIRQFHQHYGRVVVKASGLWAGKGVLVTQDLNEAFAFARELFQARPEEGVLVEAPLKGRELSLFVLSDGGSDAPEFKILGAACDYKRLLDDNLGPNTGGMGCYLPQDWPAPPMQQKIIETVVLPTLKGLAQEGLQYSGIIFIGLMIDDGAQEANVIEYNVRFGDPETQTILPALDQDLAPYLNAALKMLGTPALGELPDLTSAHASVHVVMASRGYAQGEMQLGRPITIKPLPGGAELFYAGVASGEEGSQATLTNNGGRVLGVTAVADSLEQARQLAYRGIREVSFDGMHWRSDIAQHTQF